MTEPSPVTLTITRADGDQPAALARLAILEILRQLPLQPPDLRRLLATIEDDWRAVIHNETVRQVSMLQQQLRQLLGSVSGSGIVAPPGAASGPRVLLL